MSIRQLELLLINAVKIVPSSYTIVAQKYRRETASLAYRDYVSQRLSILFQMLLEISTSVAMRSAAKDTKRFFMLNWVLLCCLRSSSKQTLAAMRKDDNVGSLETFAAQHMNARFVGWYT